MAKKNKYMELFDTILASSKYSVADQVTNCLDIVNRVLTSIATDLEMTKYNTDTTIMHPLGRFLNRYISVSKRTCMDLFVSGIPRNNIFFSGMQMDPKEVKISILLRKIEDDTLVNAVNCFTIFDTTGVNVSTKLLASAVQIDPTAKASRSNIAALRKLLGDLIDYFDLDDTVVLTLKDYNYLLGLINKLKCDIDDIKKQLKDGAVKVKRDKFDKAAKDALDKSSESGFTDIEAAAKEIYGEMITVGWINVEYKKDNDGSQIRMSFMDVKVHPTMLYISINKNEARFYLAKFVTPVDTRTGHQAVEYDLLQVATNLAGAKSFIRTNLCQ
jgi:hypothetical protein